MGVELGKQPGGGGGGGRTLPEKILTRAQLLLAAPIAAGNLVTTISGTEFENDQWYTGLAAGSGLAGLSASLSSGVLQVSTQATAGSSLRMLPHSATAALVSNLSGQPWYYYARAKFATAVDAVTEMLFKMDGFGGAPQVEFGIIGALVTTNWSYRVRNNAGTVVDLVPTALLFDQTTWHDVEILNDGSVIRFLVDGVQYGSTLATDTGTNPSLPGIFVSNGATAANRQINVDRLYVVTVSN